MYVIYGLMLKLFAVDFDPEFLLAQRWTSEEIRKDEKRVSLLGLSQIITTMNIVDIHPDNF